MQSDSATIASGVERIVTEEPRVPAPESDSSSHEPGTSLEEQLAASLARARESIVPRVLAVDDDPRNLFALEEMLRGPGIEVVLARSGEDALRHLLRDDFAVILLDVQMPQMDGYETASLIRARDRSSAVPIIFLTAVNKDDVHVFRGYTAGAVDYVFKPFDPLILRSKIHVFVELYRKTEEIRRKGEAERFLLEENIRVRGEHLRIERELRQRDEQQALILQNLPIDLFSVAIDDWSRPRFMVRGEGGQQLAFGFSAEQYFEPWFWRNRTHPDDRESVMAAFQVCMEDGAASVDFRFQDGNEQERWLLLQAVLRRDEQGRPLEINGMVIDTSERRMLEEQLQHARKLETVGRLTGGIAHDFNNMLAIVIGNLDLLQQNVESEPRAAKRAKMALDGALRCADMTRRLLAFSRKETLLARTFDVLILVRSMTDLLRRTLGDTIQVQLSAGSDVWKVHADPTGLETTVANLAVNARDAMPEGGTLTVEVGNRLMDGPFGSPAAERVIGEFVQIRVADTGTGIPPEVLSRVFEPFFTTKEVGRGTGLGLSTTFGYVKQTGGHIQIESVPGRGTEVTILLPRASPDAVDAPDPEAGLLPADDASSMTSLRGSGQHVLVVEDNGDVRRVAVAALCDLGYRTSESAGGEDALRILARDPSVHLLFSDISMPGISGAQLAEIAQQRHPELAVLLTSGFAGPVTLPDNCALLRKPYRQADLAVRLHELLHPELA